jgi:hypothetical protein
MLPEWARKENYFLPVEAFPPPSKSLSGKIPNYFQALTGNGIGYFD